MADGDLDTLTDAAAEARFAPIRALHRAGEPAVIDKLIAEAGLSDAQRDRIHARAVEIIRHIRTSGKPGMMELFLAEYGLSTNEGIALMCLAEALLRVPDPGTIDQLIEDKIAPYDWDTHLGKSQSAVVNASTVALMLTGRVLDDDNSASVMGLLNRTVKRLGEPVVRLAVKRAMAEMGNQFVLGQSIEEAVRRGAAEKKKGFLYSYDMLGEAALTMTDAQHFYDAYAHAIEVVGAAREEPSVRDASGVSVKLSALHPRFEYAKAVRLERELAPRLLDLALKAKEAGVGLNVDAEEADRLEPTLRVVDRVLADPRLAGWTGFGLVVQAYGKRAAATIDWFYQTAEKYDRKVMVRLVKGAYWDTEIKRAQVDGVVDFPVFTKRAATDVSYICCAKKLLGMTDRIYPQFATHNAHTAAAVLELAKEGQPYEFQRLHGMGETLHNHLLHDLDQRCRIYAPVGPHKDLLAYLVRRLLENGANSSFVNQIVDHTLPAEAIAADPFDSFRTQSNRQMKGLKKPTEIYAPARRNSKGWDLRNAEDLTDYDAARAPFAERRWSVGPILARQAEGGGEEPIFNPARPDDQVGTVTLASAADAEAALDAARPWEECDANARAMILHAASDLYEARFGEIFAVLAREAGKTPIDAVAELREAVDFLRYYANRAADLPANEPLGVMTCISPWNFPLAIFTGQIAAALSAGNGVIAKPAETTPIVAALGVQCLHEAGVPREVLQFLPGAGREIGAALTSDPRVSAVCFTGSTATAQAINRAMAENMSPAAPLVAETGGLNAAIVDSTALPEQAVRDTLASAFQSAGQRCSALRCLYVQDDVADGFLDMLFGAMDELQIGDPWDFATDTGPVITEAARNEIQSYVDKAKAEGRLLKQLERPADGHFVAPAVIEVRGIEDLEREVFGPVLHVARFQAEDFDQVLDAVNAKGYGLTFGLHTRIDDRVEEISQRLRVGNVYVNRNQVGAIVGSQPFGGEGLSGTGPKAGGPRYVRRFLRPERLVCADIAPPSVDAATAQAAIDKVVRPEPQILSEDDLPGPTGESNRLATWPRGLVLCLGPTQEDAIKQIGAARSVGCAALMIAPGAQGPDAVDGVLDRAALGELEGVDVVVLWSGDEDLRDARQALAARDGKIIPLVGGDNVIEHCIVERHTCIDTTAAGGNASLLGGGEG